MESVDKESKNDNEILKDLPTLESDATAAQRKLRPRLKLIKRKALSLPIKCELASSSENRYSINEHYHVFEKVGFGTYSEVRRAVDKITEQTVALKIAKGTTSINLLKNEAELLQQISSEYIPKFYSFNQDPVSNKAYLAMEYIDGKTLDIYIKEHGVFTEKTANQLLLQLIKAVEELHRNYIAHRDIKPQNIIITDDLKVKLIDLNVSKQLKSFSSTQGSSNDNKFRCVFFTQISSPLYAAPELVGLSCYTESIDIWGIGIAYAHMLIDITKLSNDGTTTIKSALSDIDKLSFLSDFSLEILESICCTDPTSRPNIIELAKIFQNHK